MQKYNAVVKLWFKSLHRVTQLAMPPYLRKSDLQESTFPGQCHFPQEFWKNHSNLSLSFFSLVLLPFVLKGWEDKKECDASGCCNPLVYRTSDAGGRYGNTAVVRLAAEVLTLPCFLLVHSNYSLVVLRVDFEKSSLHSSHCFFYRSYGRRHSAGCEVLYWSNRRKRFGKIGSGC